MDPLTTAPKPVSSCKICRAEAYYFDVVDFNKFCSQSDFYRYGLSGEPVYYLYCGNCGFIFTQHCDSWTPLEFSQRIYNDDYILVDGDYAGARTERLAEKFRQVFAGASGLQILDYGSGGGGFGQALCQNGFSAITGYDPYSHAERPEGKFDVITANEVMEHLPDPVAAFADILSFAKEDCAIIFTTMIQPDNIFSIRGSCWYLGPRNGHISFYGHRAFCEIARQYGLQYFADPGFLIMTRGKPPVPPQSPALHSATFCSPPSGIAAGWHGVERPRDAPMRWTATPEVAWPLSLKTPARLEATVPYLHEIRPGFAAECRLRVGDKSVPVAISKAATGHIMRAVIDVPGPGLSLVLETPALLAPSELRSSPDRRKLGVLIPAVTEVVRRGCAPL